MAVTFLPLQLALLVFITTASSGSTRFPALFQHSKRQSQSPLLTTQQLADFDRDGVILVRQVLRGSQLQRVTKETDRMLSEKGRFSNKLYEGLKFQTWRRSGVLRGVAMDSNIPLVVAELMRLQKHNPGDRLRLLKDGLFRLGPQQGGCGWHVDDVLFWPTQLLPPGTPIRNQGVNVWMALSDYKASQGGGMAVVPGSANPDFEHAGLISEASQVIKQRDATGFPQTCDLQKVGPSMNDFFEKNARTYDMKPGDCIFMSRECFHKGVPFSEGPVKDRYTVRYDSSSSRLLNNRFEGVLAAKGFSGGETLEQCREFYPQVFPKVLLKERLPIAWGKLKNRQ